MLYTTLGSCAGTVRTVKFESSLYPQLFVLETVFHVAQADFKLALQP